jgi:hypothetical protein
MVGLNEALIEKVPESADRITEQGNRVVETTGYLRDYNEELAGATYRELERQRLIAQSNERQIRQDIVDLQKELNEGREREAEIRAEIRDFDEGAVASRLEEIDLQLESNDLSIGKQTQLMRERHELENKLDTLRDELATQIETIDQNEIAIEQKKQELGLADEIAGMMADQLLEQLGINDAKGEGIEKINEAIAKEEESIAQLRKLQEEQGGLNSDVDNEISRRQENIRKLEATRGKVNDLVGGQAKYNDKIYEGYLQAKKLDDSLSVSDYLKSVNITDGGTLAALEARMSRPVTKTLNIAERTLGKYGIKYHQGGLIGKRSGTLADIPKLHSGGTGASLMRDNPPMHNEVDVRLLRNEMVLTEGQQANLFRTLESSGASTGGRSEELLAQMLGALGAIESKIQQIDPQFSIELDGAELGRVMEPRISGRQARDFDAALRLRGEKRR